MKIKHLAIIGHKAAHEELQHDLRDRHVASSYLFVGPEHVGKFSVAKWFAGELQGEINGANLDLIELQDDGESIKVEPIRELIARLNMTPQSPYKILIIQSLRRMTPAAMSCLLKTLEEPPERTIFIFTTESIRDVLPTISSRMRIIRFNKLPDELLRSELKATYPKLGDKLLDSVVTLAMGRPGRAFALIDDPELSSETHELYNEVEVLLERRSPAHSFQLVERLIKEPEKLDRFMEILLLLVRRHMIESDNTSESRRFAALAEDILKAQELRYKNINTRLLLENLLLHVI